MKTAIFSATIGILVLACSAWAGDRERLVSNDQAIRAVEHELGELRLEITRTEREGRRQALRREERRIEKQRLALQLEHERLVARLAAGGARCDRILDVRQPPIPPSDLIFYEACQKRVLDESAGAISRANHCESSAASCGPSLRLREALLEEAAELGAMERRYRTVPVPFDEQRALLARIDRKAKTTLSLERRFRFERDSCVSHKVVDAGGKSVSQWQPQLPSQAPAVVSPPASGPVLVE
ncbi:MAG: hypothetical protein HY075_09825 [Deltaproteobacteria bacterium]|nr:hypothetical protein [Deltaproteobacteria bacterium]